LNRLNRAVHHCETAEQRQQLQAQLKALPDVVALLNGDERQILDRLDRDHQQLERTRGSLHDQLREAKATLEAVQLPQEGVPNTDLRRARAVRSTLGPLENEITQKRDREKEAQAEAEAAGRRLGDQVTEKQLQTAGSTGVGELSEFARAVHGLHAQERQHEVRRGQLDQPEPEEIRGFDADQLRNGIQALSEWLVNPGNGEVRRRWPWWLLVAGGVIVGLAIVLATVHHPLWLLVALIGLGLPLGQWWASGTKPVDARSVHRTTYQRMDLPAPEAWREDAVSQLLSSLCGWLAQRKQADDRSRRLAELEGEEILVKQQRDRLERQCDELQERLGCNVDMEDAWLPVLVDNLSRWQQQRDAVSAAQAVREVKEEEHADQRQELNTILRRYGLEDVTNARQADEAVNDLADRNRRHKEATDKWEEAQRRLDEEIEPQLGTNAQERQQLFERLDISESEAGRIDDWLEQRSHYQEIAQRLSEKDVICSQIAEELQDQPELLELNRPELEARIDEQQRIADSREPVSEEIGRIEQAIKSAKAGHELSAALEEHDAALAVLADARDENRANVVGHVVAEWVREEAVERSRPEVYRRADELLVRITNGMLQLDVDDRAREPAFRARYGDQPPRSVDQLSVGERVQLLVAVRLAFMEQDEPSRLPLLLDEALGTSDDDRARAIIDSVIAIAGEGRQVFYFTAQTDEVGKWLPRLEEAGVPHRTIDLQAERGVAASKQQPLRIAEVQRSSIPSPDGRDRSEYAEVLCVPGINPRHKSQEHMHIWHVVHDLDVLHQLLERGVREWGQLRILLDHGGEKITHNVEELERARARAAAIEAACEAWRVGRGCPVDRAALEDSDCVSEKFIDELAELAAQWNGDAAALISALEQNQVKYWRADNTEKLREYFVEHGYLPQREPLEREMIQTRALASVADKIRTGAIDRAWVDAMVASLPD